MLQVALQHDDGIDNQLLYNAVRLKRFTALTPKVIAITSLYSPERRRVERFLERGFSKAYAATIKEHYPVLMSVQDARQNILGALGFRYADEQPLFLEQYIDDNIESVLLGSFEEQVTRKDVVEVGSLVSNGNGASVFLFTALTAYLAQQGRQFISVTATDSLHRYFKRIGMQPRQIGFADKQRLPDEGATWGSYYDTCPRLLAGKVLPAFARLQQHLHMRLVEHDADWTAQLHEDMRAS